MHNCKCSMYDNKKVRNTNEVTVCITDLCTYRKVSGIRSSNRRRLFVGFSTWDFGLMLPSNSPFLVFILNLCRSSLNTFKVCKSVYHHTVQIYHQPEATVFQFIILTFIYSSTCYLTKSKGLLQRLHQPTAQTKC